MSMVGGPVMYADRDHPSSIEDVNGGGGGSGSSGIRERGMREDRIREDRPMNGGMGRDGPMGIAGLPVISPSRRHSAVVRPTSALDYMVPTREKVRTRFRYHTMPFPLVTPRVCRTHNDSV